MESDRVHYATATVKRSDFGINWNQTLAGTAVVGDDVQIELRVEAESLAAPHEFSPALVIDALEQNNGPHPGSAAFIRRV